MFLQDRGLQKNDVDVVMEAWLRCWSAPSTAHSKVIVQPSRLDSILIEIVFAFWGWSGTALPIRLFFPADHRSDVHAGVDRQILKNATHFCADGSLRIVRLLL